MTETKQLANKCRALFNVCGSIEEFEKALNSIEGVPTEHQQALLNFAASAITSNTNERKSAIHLPEDEEIKIMFHSDTHYIHYHTRFDWVNVTYEEAYDEGYEKIFHVGDITDGIISEHGKHKENLLAYNFEDTISLIKANFPRVGIQTIAIGGDQDRGYDNNQNIGKAIQEALGEDIFKFLGFTVQDYEYCGLLIRMIHGNSNPPWRLEKNSTEKYNVEKRFLTLPRGRKPDIIVRAHSHKHYHFNTKDMLFLQTPAFHGPNKAYTKNQKIDTCGVYWVKIKRTKHNHLKYDVKFETPDEIIERKLKRYNLR